MRQRPTLETLEPRILYSADTPSALAAALVGTPDAEHRLLDAEGEFAVQSAPQEIVFIDARTPDSAQLVEDITAQSGRDVEVVVLDAERNGLDQISEALAGRENVAALHFIAHGGEGVIQLGNTLITADALERNPGVMEAWSQVLTADADILLYGCDVAATAEGRLLADTLARLTGADVSASDDATGHASLGGDWNLEYSTGAIEATVALSANTQDAWAHLLPSVVLTSYEPPFANMTDNAYEIAGGTTYAQSFSHVSGAGTYTANQIDLVLYRNAVTTGADINVELRDAPSGGTLLASGSVSRAELSTSENWVVVSLDATATLTDGTTYYVVIKGTGGGNIFLGIDDAGAYAGGNLIIDGTAQPAKDIAFRIVSSDAPVVDLNGNQQGQDFTAAFTEQTPVLIARNTATVTDPNSANLASLTATLTARPDGDAVESLSATVTGGLAVNYDQATGVLSITGSASVATYQAILRGIQYNNTSDAPTTTNRVVSVVVSDGTTPSAARTSVITVTAVNDAPVNNVPGAQTTDEDTALVFSVAGGNAISITDDAGTNPVQVVLSSTNGVITLAGIAGLSFTAGDGTADGAMTFTGTVAAINAALDGMSFMPSAEFSGAASLSITTDDLGNTGVGTPSPDTDTVAITVNVVNDPPVAADDSYTVIEDGALDTDALWFDSAWAYRRVLSFDNTAQAENLTDFPVLVALDASRIDYSQTQNSGQDLRFVDGDGTVLAHEIAVWNESGTSYVWVKVPQVDGGSGTDFIWMYYGNAAAPDGQNAASVWSNDYRAVYHLDENPGPVGTVVDSAGLFNATNVGTTDVGGYIASAQEFDGINDYVNLGANRPFLNNASGATISLWMNADSISAQDSLFGVSVGGAPSAFSRATLDLDAGRVWLVGRSTDTETGRDLLTAPGVISTGVWHYLTGVIDYANDTLTIYVDGVQVASASAVGFASAATPGTNSALGAIGAQEGGSFGRFNGTLDEVSLADSARTADWIAAQYASMSGAFVTYGSELSSAGVLGNDADIDSALLTAALVSGPANAAFFSLDADGSFVYVPIADFYGVDSFTYTANDGTSDSAVATVTITVTPVNDAPVNAVPAGAQATNEDTTLVFSSANGNAISIADVDAGTSAVQVTLSGTNAVITLASTAGLSFSAGDGSADGTMTFSGTVAAINAALNGLSFTPDLNFNGAASLSINTNDQGNTGAGGALSDLDTLAITVNAVNDAPVLAGAGGTLAYTEDDAATLIDATLALSDVDDLNIESATVTISAGLVSAEDVLNFTSAFGITGSYSAATGMLALSGSATLAQYEQVLESVTYQNTNTGNPNTGARTITWVVNDGTDNSAAVTSTITVAAVNDAPVLSAVQLTVSEGGMRVFAPADFSISDPDNGAFTYTVSGVAGGGFEVFNGVTWNAAGSFTTAQVAAGQVRFVDDGDEVAPSFSITANDGAANSATIAGTVSYTPVNDAPVLAGTGGTLAYTEDDAATLIDATLALSDVDDLNIESAMVTISAGLVSAEDVLNFTSAFGISGTYTAATGVLSLSGSATLAQYEQVLESVTYQNTNTGNPNTGARTVTWVVNDGTDNSAAVTSTVTVAAVNDAPVNAVPGAQATNEDAALVFSAANGNAISIADLDAGAGPVRVVLTGTNGAITLAGIAGLTFSVGDGAADAAMTFSGSVGAINAALNGMSFTPSAEFSGAASVSIDIDDQGNSGTGGALSDSDAVAITVNVVNDAPTVSASGGTTVFTGGGGAVVVDTALAVADVDNTTLAAATVSISGGFQAGQDMLGFSNDPATMGNIAGSYNAATGVLSLSSAGATATLAQWQAALRSVSYDNTSATPIVVPRSVSFDVSDGNSYGPVASHSVTVNPAPVVPPGPPPVVPPPVVPPPVVIGPPPVTPPPPTPAPQPAAAPLRSAGAAAPEEAPIQPVSVDFAERPHNPIAVATASSSDASAPAFRLAAYGSATASDVVGDLLGEIMRQADARANGMFQLGEKGRSAGEGALSEEIESLRETLREQDEIQSRGTVVLAAGSLSMTLAYLLWLVRGGALVASALSALPAWRILDPLPILARAPDDEDEEEDGEEEDQTIVSFADEPVGARK